MAKPECNSACVLRNKTKLYRKRNDLISSGMLQLLPLRSLIFIKFMFIERLLHKEFILVQAEVTTGQETSRHKFPASCLRAGQLHMQLCHRPVTGKGTTRGVVFSDKRRRRGELWFANCEAQEGSRGEVKLRCVCLSVWGWEKQVRKNKTHEREQREVTIGRLLIGKPPQAQQAEQCYTHWHTNTQARTNTCGWDEAQTDRVS